jgi:hypothetical protein
MSAMTDEPIKFRCYKCNKLLGVPARKVGSIVSCPQCQADLQVPRLEAAAPPAGPTAPTAAPEAAVEPAPAAGIDPGVPMPDLFATPETPPATVLDESLIAAITAEPPSIRSSRDPSDRPTAEVVLSPVIVLAWSLLVLMAVPLAFIAGLLTGHFVWK